MYWIVLTGGFLLLATVIGLVWAINHVDDIDE